MRLVRLHIDGFGKFNNYSLEFEPGVNILYGRNEAGKSTLHCFLRAMLFGAAHRIGTSEKTTIHEKMCPWDLHNGFGGTLTVEEDGQFYTIRRDFLKSAEDLVITDDKSGQEAADPSGLLKKLLHSLTETGYMNTVSIGQLGVATDGGMIDELRRYTANIHSTGSFRLSADRAISVLNEKKARLLDGYHTDAAKNYANTVSNIKNLEASLNVPENDNELREYSLKRDTLKRDYELIDMLAKLLTDDINRREAVLSENNFSDLRSIQDYEAAVDARYSEMTELEKKAGNRSPVILAVVLFAAAAAVAGAVIGSIRVLNPLMLIVLAAAAAAAAAAGAVLLVIRRKNRLKSQAVKEELTEAVSSLTGSGFDSENSMELFHSRIAELTELCENVDSDRDRRTKMSDRMNELGREISRCGESIEEQQRIGHQVEQKLIELNAYRDQVSELKSVIAENNDIRNRVDAIDIAIEKIDELADEIGRTAGVYLNAEAGRFIKGITKGKYRNLDAGRNLELCLHTNERVVPVRELSSGTIDQVYLALRMAAVRLIDGCDDVLPLLFDDSFALYDDDRLRSALTYISKDYKGQMLVFTCHHREAEALESEGLGFKELYI